MGKTIRNYDRDGLKGMKVIKKSKPRKKHIKIDVDYDELNDLYDDTYDELLPDMYSE